jgi:hypothetical protein
MLDKQPIRNLKKWMLDEFTYKYSFNEQQMDIYNKVVDAVMYQILNTENNPNPYYKKED